MEPRIPPRFAVCVVAALVLWPSIAQSAPVAISRPKLPPAWPNAAQSRIELHAQSNGHVYVAGAYVERFRIAHGVPRSTPDRVYADVAAPIAIDSAGYLYASGTSSVGSCPFVPAVIVFSPRSKKPVRTLPVFCASDLYSAAISGLSVDSGGYLYVALAVSRLEGGCAWYVSVYPRGGDESVQTIDAGAGNSPSGDCQQLDGLVEDGQQELHVSSTGLAVNSVLSFASPITNPTLIADLTGTGIRSPSGLAVGASDELYVDNANLGSGSFVAVYPATANGDAHPRREITVSGSQSFGTGIAVADNHLLVPDNIANAVYEALATRGGAQRPIWTLSATSPEDVKIGP